jgi:hypothetical protein
MMKLSDFAAKDVVLIVTAASTLIISIFGYMAAREARLQATEAKAQAIVTHAAVNSRMDELLLIARSEAGLKATAVEKQAEKKRKAEAAATERPLDYMVE